MPCARRCGRDAEKSRENHADNLKETAQILRRAVWTIDRWRDEGVEGVKLVPEKIGVRYFYTEALIAELQRQVDMRRGRLPGQRRTKAAPKGGRKRKGGVNDG
jgi:hypothetical protein